MPVFASPIPTPAEIAVAAAAVRSTPGWEPACGGERLLILGIIEQAVEVLKRWCAEWRPRAAGAAIPRDNADLRQARHAAEWLLSDGCSPPYSSRFSFAEICDHLGLDIANARRRIFAQFDVAPLRDLASPT